MDTHHHHHHTIHLPNIFHPQTNIKSVGVITMIIRSNVYHYILKHNHRDQTIQIVITKLIIYSFGCLPTFDHSSMRYVTYSTNYYYPINILPPYGMDIYNIKCMTVYKDYVVTYEILFVPPPCFKRLLS